MVNKICYRTLRRMLSYGEKYLHSFYKYLRSFTTYIHYVILLFLFFSKSCSGVRSSYRGTRTLGFYFFFFKRNPLVQACVTSAKMLARL